MDVFLQQVGKQLHGMENFNSGAYLTWTSLTALKGGRGTIHQSLQEELWPESLHAVVYWWSLQPIEVNLMSLAVLQAGTLSVPCLSQMQPYMT